MAKRILKDEKGAVLVEFTIVAPLLLLLMAGIADLGGMLYVRFKLNEAMSAAASYAFTHSQGLAAAGVDDLATELVGLIDTNLSSGWATVVADINQTTKATVTGGMPSFQSVGGDIDSCFCPSTGSGTVVFGSPVNCGDDCPDGGQAARFIWLETSRHYDPIFASYGIVENGNIKATALVPVN